jgi:hypothetical protein
MSAGAPADIESMRRLVTRTPQTYHDGRVLAIVTLVVWVVLMLLLAGEAAPAPG